MWDLIVSIPDHCLSFYFPYADYIKRAGLELLNVRPENPTPLTYYRPMTCTYMY